MNRKGQEMRFNVETPPGRIIRLAREVIREPNQFSERYLLQLVPVYGKAYLLASACPQGTTVAAGLPNGQVLGLYVLGSGRWHERLSLTEIGPRTDVRLVNPLCENLEIPVPEAEAWVVKTDRIIAREFVVRALGLFMDQMKGSEQILHEEKPAQKKFRVVAGGMS